MNQICNWRIPITRLKESRSRGTIFIDDDTDLIENVYYKYDLESIYLYKADLYRKGILLFKKSNDEKIRLINLAYKDIVFGSWSFVLSLITLAIIKMASI
jgi:hypothetical protein